MIRYAITDGVVPPGKVAQWAATGIDFVQLRNKSVGAGALAELAGAMLTQLADSRTRLLVNGRADVALAVGAGVHLTSGAEELTPPQVRAVFERAGAGPAIVSVSCHTLTDVARARSGGADLILFGPVFEKRVDGMLVSEGAGLEMLQRASDTAGNVPVLALGGVTDANAMLCLAAGAAGVAGIRLFASEAL